jgi:hypothetical protein
MKTYVGGGNKHVGNDVSTSTVSIRISAAQTEVLNQDHVNDRCEKDTNVLLEEFSLATALKRLEIVETLLVLK